MARKPEFSQFATTRLRRESDRESDLFFAALSGVGSPHAIAPIPPSIQRKPDAPRSQDVPVEATENTSVRPVGSPWSHEAPVEATEDISERSAPSPAQSVVLTEPAAREVVLHRARVQLPLTRQRIDVAKVLNSATGQAETRAITAAGSPVDLPRLRQAELTAHLRRYRQVHPALSRAADRVGPQEPISILAWIYHNEELPNKRDRSGPPLVASAEMSTRSNAAATTVEPRPHGSLRRTLESARAEFERLGVVVTASLGVAPVLAARVTKAQLDQLAQLPQVTGLYLHERTAVLDLDNSIADARATDAHSAGRLGQDISLAIWEETPADASQLVIEETFNSTAAASQAASERNHAQLVTAVVKNVQTSSSHGFAPRAKVFSANTFGLDALVWAIHTKRCSVVNQSFHRSSEETDPSLSVEDLVKDYLILRPPFPFIVQAAGNGPATEFVNHKGFNSVTVGNHIDGATAMRPTSVFRNPSSPHDDRELPDLCANGTTVTATGQTMTGTSFASPAVAGTAAVLQSMDPTLSVWPEGVRAILLASAGRNVSGGTWNESARSAGVDGIDGSGALDTGEAARIAHVRANRTATTGAGRGWDVRTVQSSDFDANGLSTFTYSIRVPDSGVRRIKAAIAWDSKVVYTDAPGVTPPVQVTESRLTVDLDLHLFHGNRLVAHSSTFDNSFEIVEFDAQHGQSYTLRVRLWSGSDWVWLGIAWTIH